MVKIDISKLMNGCAINHQGYINTTSNMSGLEPIYENDWLYLGLKSFKQLSNLNPKRFAIIGSGNGIDAIAVLKLYPKLKELYITDIVSNLLLSIDKNIKLNIKNINTNLFYVSGRDCLPLKGKFDIIYGNLPLLMVSEKQSFNKKLSTTTLTSFDNYKKLSKGNNDLLKRYSLLSQLGFLLSAKEKLNKNGKIITLIGGRVPLGVIKECFSRAKLKHKLLFVAFMRQSDPQFLKQYAFYSKEQKVDFLFYDYDKAIKLLKKQNIKAPEIVNCSLSKLQTIILKAKIDAIQAYDYYKKGKEVGHIAFAFELFK